MSAARTAFTGVNSAAWLVHGSTRASSTPRAVSTKHNLVVFGANAASMQSDARTIHIVDCVDSQHELQGQKLAPNRPKANQ